MRFLFSLLAAVFMGGQVMADDSLVGNALEHHEDLGYFINVFDHRPERLAFMEKHGLQGGGPTWRALLSAALELEAPKTTGSLVFDDESDVLLVRSESKAAMQVVQSLVTTLMTDPEFMQRCISKARDGRYLE